MTEREIVKNFCKTQIHLLEEVLKVRLRLYCIEFPVKTTDGTKYADVVLEVVDAAKFREKQLYVLEFKKDKIDYHSAISQVTRYTHFIAKQLYKDKKALPILMAPEFSRWEIRNAKLQGVHCIVYEPEGHIRFIC